MNTYHHNNLHRVVLVSTCAALAGACASNRQTLDFPGTGECQPPTTQNTWVEAETLYGFTQSDLMASRTWEVEDAVGYTDGATTYLNVALPPGATPATAIIRSYPDAVEMIHGVVPHTVTDEFGSATTACYPLVRVRGTADVVVPELDISFVGEMQMTPSLLQLDSSGYEGMFELFVGHPDHVGDPAPEGSADGYHRQYLSRLLLSPFSLDEAAGVKLWGWVPDASSTNGRDMVTYLLWGTDAER